MLQLTKPFTTIFLSGTLSQIKAVLRLLFAVAPDVLPLTFIAKTDDLLDGPIDITFWQKAEG